MSIRLMTAAWAADVRPTLKLVLLALCDNASDEGNCYPLISTLVRKCGLSERAVQGAITELEAAGHVQRHLRHNRSTVYSVHPLASPQELHPPSPQQMRLDPQELHPPPAADAPRPAGAAPITIIEPSGESSPERETRKRATARGAKRCPTEFVVTPEMRAWSVAECAGVDLNRETAKFRDHEFDRGRIDWIAAWRNWMRNARPSSQRGPAPTQTVPTDPELIELRAEASRIGFRNELGMETTDQFRAALKRYQETLAKSAATKLGIDIGGALKGMMA